MAKGKLVKVKLHYRSYPKPPSPEKPAKAAKPAKPAKKPAKRRSSGKSPGQTSLF